MRSRQPPRRASFSHSHSHSSALSLCPLYFGISSSLSSVTRLQARAGNESLSACECRVYLYLISRPPLACLHLQNSCGARSAPRQVSVCASVSVSTITFACRCLPRHSRRFLLFSGIASLCHLSCSSLICQFETLLIRCSLAPLGL